MLTKSARAAISAEALRRDNVRVAPRTTPLLQSVHRPLETYDEASRTAGVMRVILGYQQRVGPLLVTSRM